MKQFNKSKKFDKKYSFGKRNFARADRKEFDESKDTDRSEKKDFGRDNRKPEFSKRDFGKTKDSGLKLYPATCDECGEDCELPFKPSGGKPVYCRSCFKQNSESGLRNKPAQRFNERIEPKRAVSSEDIDRINRKLDKIMKALEID